MKQGKLPQSGLSVVAVPAHNEASCIAECLAALALQRDETGAPIAGGCFEILIDANNCSDETASIARQASLSVPHAVRVVEEDMPSGQRNAGWARKRAMDLAAIRLAEVAPIHGSILTTDADSRVAPTWLAATLREFDKGVDCVAGYIDAIPGEYLAPGKEFLTRGRLEDTYLRYVAEIYARCDPKPHDPWPNHRVSSGASLAVTLAAYSAVGGLPPRPVGEDSALTDTLRRAGFKVRHSMDVCVTTSCRFDGRAKGGAADTMRHRHAVPDAPCDEDLEPALQATRRALCKGMLRERWMKGPTVRPWPAALEASTEIANLFDGKRASSFEDAWETLCDHSPALKIREPLRPSALPRQIAIAKMIVHNLRAAPGGRHDCRPGPHLARGRSRPSRRKSPDRSVLRPCRGREPGQQFPAAARTRRRIPSREPRHRPAQPSAEGTQAQGHLRARPSPRQHKGEDAGFQVTATALLK